jgi:hypothetical protein
MELANRPEIEAKFAARMARLHGKFRNQLTDLLGNPPNPANVPESFWSEAEDEMRRDLAIVLLLIAGGSAAQHGLRLDSSLSAAQWAETRSQLVAPQWATNGRERLVSRLRVNPPLSAEEIAADVFNPSRAQTIATTETTTATSAGGEIGVAETIGLSDLDQWFTAEDDRVCPICGPLHESIRDTWMAQFPDGPPAHPNCRCWIQYARELEHA